jgi:uncharacterized protein
MYKYQIESTLDFVKDKLADRESGHDWWHVQRVWKLTRFLLRHENASKTVCELAALLHDLPDNKFNTAEEANRIKYEIQLHLRSIELSDSRIESIENIIEEISFRGGVNKEKEKSIELMIVQDADRLDAIGAIGIARTFNYGGYKNRQIYNPEIDPKSYSSSEEYLKSESPTINHFYEKLLLLKNLMNTSTAKKLARQRHQFMLDFLDRFFLEWEGKA